MAKTKLELILEMKDRLSSSLKKAKDAVSTSTEEMKQKMRSLKTTFVGALAEMRQELPLLDKALKLIHNPIVMLTTAIGAVAAGVRRLHQFANECVETYKVQAEAESKLAQVMRNTMGARNSEIDSIKRLASEQQKLGVIGDEVQLAGAQELGTYLTKAKNLRTLLPVMNDMVAQQYGYNATQESAVNIATMMGKVMDGQVGALSRYGYKFTEAQEAILKFGTEEQRAATLAEVVSESVGGVNAALAQNPEGALKQYENNLGDLHERFGQFFTYIRAAWLPVGQAFMDGWNKVAALFESHRTQIMSVIQTVASHVATVINGVFTMLGYLKNAVSFLYEWRAAIYGAAAAYAILNAKQIAAITLTGLQAAKTAILTAAQWLLNVAMSANPIGIIIVAIGALIGAIVAVCQKFEGWTSVWEATKTTLVNSFRQFVATMKFAITDLWLGIQILWERTKGVFSSVKPWLNFIGLTIKTAFHQYIANWKFAFSELWYSVQIFWQKIKGFGEYIGQLFTNIGKAMKAALKLDFDEAKALLNQKITTKADLRVQELEAERDAARQQFKDESLDRAKEVANAYQAAQNAPAQVNVHLQELRDARSAGREQYVDETMQRAKETADAWRSVDLHKKVSSADETAEAGDAVGVGSEDYEGNSGSIAGTEGAGAASAIAGSAKQIRNITVNIDAFNKGGINTTNTQGLQGMSATDIEEWFNQLLLRAIRNIELSY